MVQPLTEIKRLESRNTFRNRFFRFGLAIVFFEFLSSLWLLYENQFSYRVMFLVLSHTFLGYFLIITLLMLVHRHILYRKAWPSKVFDFLALMNVGTLAGAIATGIWIHWFGFTGSVWLWWTHLATSFLFVTALGLYIGIIILNGRKSANHLLINQYYRLILRISLTVIAITSLLIGVLELSYGVHDPPDPIKRVDNYSLDLLPNKLFHPSSVQTETGDFYEEAFFTNSRSCGGRGCHNDSVRQWEESTHYRTPGPLVLRVRDRLIEEGNDKTLFAETHSSHFEALRDAKPGREVFRHCAGCHAPVALVSGYVNPGSLVESFEKFEGISCKVCHRMSENRNWIRGPGNYSLAAAPKLLFEDDSSILGRHLYRTLIRTRPDNHKEMFSRTEYKSSNVCRSCHFTNQFESWQQSRYNNAADPGKSKQCQNCHMPQEPAHDDISAKAKGTLASHRFPSAGFTMADYFGLKTQFEKTKSFIQDKKVAAEIFIPEFIGKGIDSSFLVRVTNIGVGHFFPAGPEVELIESWLRVDVFDQAGKKVLQFGQLDKSNYLDYKRNRVWRGRSLDSHGRPLEQDRHRSWRFARDELNVIPPKQYDEVPFEIPKYITGKSEHLKIAVQLMYRRPNQSFADWAFGKGKYKVPAIPVASVEKVVRVTRDKRAAQEALARFKEFVGKPTSEYVRIGNRPIVTSRITIEDGLKVHNALLLSSQGRNKEALQLLQLVSPLFLDTHPATREHYTSLLKQIAAKAAEEPSN